MATKTELKDVKADMMKGFIKLEAGQKDHQRQINDLKLDAPTQKEFDNLKARVDRFHPPN